MNKLLAITLAAVVSGCTIGPDYVKPEINTPKQWRNTVSNAQNTTNTQWWKQLGDPVLNRLIDQAIQGNYDLKIAVARVDQFMGLYGATRSNLFPQLSGSYKAEIN